MATEELRQRFRPAQVRLLLIGESPPAGGSSFYMGNSNLYRYTAEAFSLAYSRPFISPQEFLDFFRDLGCYLDDLCLAPVNHLNRVTRRTARVKAAADFAKRLAELQPLAVACVIKSIEPHVKQSLALMKLGSVPMVALSFPAMGHQRAYVSGLVAFLTELARCGVLLGPGRVT